VATENGEAPGVQPLVTYEQDLLFLGEGGDTPSNDLHCLIENAHMRDLEGLDMSRSSLGD
jgi:hypothetical protein